MAVRNVKWNLQYFMDHWRVSFVFIIMSLLCLALSSLSSAFSIIEFKLKMTNVMMISCIKFRVFVASAELNQRTKIFEITRDSAIAMHAIRTHKMLTAIELQM